MRPTCLKTPLTALRLELEELTLRDDVPDDAKAAATRCIGSVDDVNRSAGELVALSRRGNLVEGAELTLHDLATQLAQRWADRLAEERRPLSASAEGDLTMAFTPGPVEHILDLVLSDIVLAGKGPVKITFLAEHDHLRIRMPAGVVANGSRRRGRQPGAGIAEARKVAESQGGRVTGDGETDGPGDPAPASLRSASDRTDDRGRDRGPAVSMLMIGAARRSPRAAGCSWLGEDVGLERAADPRRIDPDQVLGRQERPLQAVRQSVEGRGLRAVQGDRVLARGQVS